MRELLRAVAEALAAARGEVVDCAAPKLRELLAAAGMAKADGMFEVRGVRRRWLQGFAIETPWWIVRAVGVQTCSCEGRLSNQQQDMGAVGRMLSRR